MNKPVFRAYARLLAPFLLVAPVIALAAPAPAAKPAAPQALAFAKNDHAGAKGKFKAPATVSREYTVELKAGQIVDVEIKDNKKQITFFNVFPPGAPQRETEGRSRQTVTARADGVYTIHTFMTQGAVDKGEAASYELSIKPKAARP